MKVASIGNSKDMAAVVNEIVTLLSPAKRKESTVYEDLSDGEAVIPLL